MNFWRRLRQIDRIESLEAMCAIKITALREAEHEIAMLRSELDKERALRIGMEALASERRSEVDRLIEELRQCTERAEKLFNERLRSLDALNLRLMEARAEPPAPDMSKYRAAEKLGIQAIGRIRQLHAQVDQAMLAKLHPKFAHLARKGEAAIGNGVLGNAVMEAKEDA